jgi:hypothetical protein
MEPTVWLAPPFGKGEPKEVEASPEVLTPWMIKGWYQCAPPAPAKQEDKKHVGN